MSLASFTPRALSEAAIIMGNAQRDFFGTEVFRPSAPSRTQLIDFGSLVVNPQILNVSREGEASKPVPLLAGSLKTVQPPIYRPSKSINASDAATMNPALAAYNWVATDPNENLRQQIDLDMMDLVQKIRKSHAVNCALAISAGSLTLTHEDATTDTISYGYGSAGTDVDDTILTALSGADYWTESTSVPDKDIQAMVENIRKTTDIDTPIALIMGSTAYYAFRGHARIKDIYDNRRYDGNSLNWNEAVQYKGVYDGSPVFCVSLTYKTAAGTWTEAFPANKVVAVPLGTNLFTTEYGAIFETPGPDTMPTWIPTQYFSKQLVEQDPAVNKIIVESRPVPVIKQPLAVRVQQVTA